MLKYIVISLFSIFAILFITLNININNKAFDVIATFLSITTGFTITALSIIATSPFSKNLYEQESKKNNSKTLLHELVDLFKVSMILFVITIGLIIILNLYPEKYVANSLNILKTKTNTLEILKSIALYLSALCLISFISLFRTFSKFVIKSGKSIK